jgi:hypothetical protein
MVWAFELKLRSLVASIASTRHSLFGFDGPCFNCSRTTLVEANPYFAKFGSEVVLTENHKTAIDELNTKRLTKPLDLGSANLDEPVSMLPIDANPRNNAK